MYKTNSGALGFGILLIQNLFLKLHVRVSEFLCSYIPTCISDFCQGCIPLDTGLQMSLKFQGHDSLHIYVVSANYSVFCMCSMNPSPFNFVKLL